MTNAVRAHLYVPSKTNKQTNKQNELTASENRLVVARSRGRRVGHMREGGQKVQICLAKRCTFLAIKSLSQRGNVQYDDYRE